MAGYIFLCDNTTEQECLQRLLFGTNNPKIYTQNFQSIQIGDWVFLFNYEKASLKGLFRALTPCSKDIEPHAWKDRKGLAFPFQVRISADGEYGKALSADEIQHIVHLSPTKFGLIPPSKIPNETVRELVNALQKKNNDFTPIPARVPKEQLTSRAYIFRCDRVTGGKCFSDNVMGAPVAQFKPIVSHIQTGDTIFLWLIEERKLYGVWRARSRGQYDPIVFDGRFPAVVFCERLFDLERGIPEESFRAIVPFDGTLPPYRINHEQSQSLLDVLLSENTESSELVKDKTEGKYLCEDGHFVRSYSEIIIDNWLYNHHIVHAYEHRMQIGLNFLRCDFYIPTEKVFIEFWGKVGDPKYDDRRQKKKAMYDQAGVRLLELFPMDIPVLSEVLPAKLAQYGISILGAYGRRVHEPSDPEPKIKGLPSSSDRTTTAVHVKPEKIRSAAVEKYSRSGAGKVYTYRISKYGIVARIEIRNGSFVVLAGSTATGLVNDSMAEGHRRKRQELISIGQLVRDGKTDLYVFNSDVTFNSPSEASGVISGSSTNGWQCFGIPRD